MFYVMSEMLIYLLIALGLGFFLGWLMHSKRGLGELDAQVRKQTQTTRNEHSAFNNKIATLETKLDSAEKELATTRKSSSERDKLRADLIKAQTETEAVRGELDAAESRAGTLQNELETAQGNSDKCRTELEQAHKDATSLRDKLGRSDDVIARLQADNEGLKKAADSVPCEPEKEDIDSMEKDLEAAQIELAAARESMEQALDGEDDDLEIEIIEADEEDAAPAAAPAADDDLKIIKGIGPVLERKLKAMGLTSFAQLANLSDADGERINAELNFKDRHLRDNWKGKAAKAHKEKYGSDV